MWDGNSHYRVHNFPPLASFLSQMNPMHDILSCICNIIFLILSCHLRLIFQVAFPSQLHTDLLCEFYISSVLDTMPDKRNTFSAMYNLVVFRKVMLPGAPSSVFIVHIDVKQNYSAAGLFFTCVRECGNCIVTVKGRKSMSENRIRGNVFSYPRYLFSLS